MDDKDFIKKEYKNLSPFWKIATWAFPILGIGILILATLFLFVWKQDCGPIDKEFVWCYVHPATFWGILGLVLFYSGGLYIIGVLPYALIWFFGVADDSDGLKTGYVVAATFLLGFFLIYV